MPATGPSSRELALAALALALCLALAASWAVLRDGSRPTAALPVLAGADGSTSDAERAVPLALAPVRSAAPAQGSRSPAKAYSGDPVGILLFGAVRAPTGEPLHGGRLVLQRAGAAELSIPFGGSYAVSGLAPGRWRATWSQPGFFPEVRELDLGSEPQLLRVDVELIREPRPRIRAFTPNGEPLRSALAHAKLDASRLVAVATERPSHRNVREPSSSTWATLGTFEPEPHRGAGASSEWIGWMRLQRRLPVYVHLLYGEVALSTVELTSFPEEIDFTCSLASVLRVLGSLRLHAVASASRESLAQVRVELRPAGNAARSIRSVDPWPGQVGAVLPGTFQVAVSAPGHFPRTFEARIEPDRVCDLGIIELQRAIAIRGRAADPSGAGRPVPVACLRWLEDSGEWQPAGRVECSPAGIFQVSGVPEGLYALRVEGDGPYAAWGSDGLLVDGREASQPEIFLPLRATSKLVLRSAGRALLRFTVSGAQGIPLRAGSLQPGQSAVLKLPPGSYTLLWSDTIGQRTPEPIALGEQPLEIALGP
ncbi:MAG TPA: hypothetical protein VMS76_08895 [Planctomycetota bacterium]|nr:hypothetical protein [Planctomycetota bacterium]